MITSTKHYKSIESAIVKFNKLTGNIDCPVALIYLQKSKMNIDVSFLYLIFIRIILKIDFIVCHQIVQQQE